MVVSVDARRTEKCEMEPSTASPGKMDVHCNCMQRLRKVDVPVASLIINQTGCSRVGLEVSWPTLETEVAPEVLVLAGARVYFKGDAAAPWQHSITKITFIECTFLEVPDHAFSGLKLLEEVSMVGGAVGAVRRGAFSDLPRLHIVEVTNASLGEVEGGAWARLPALTYLALWHCSIGKLKSHAINLTRDGGSARQGGEACGETRDGVDDQSRMLEVLSGRSSLGARNLSLPHFGTQLLLFKNSINEMEQRALSGDAFGFLIMGSNLLGSVATAALNLALHNPCEISAALLVDNTVAGLQDGAFEALRGWQGAPHRTFLALTNNTFNRVAPRAFTLHRDLHVYAANQNRFRCRCPDLMWAAPAATTERHDLQEALLGDGLCQDGTSLNAFHNTCIGNPAVPSHTILPPPLPTTTTNHHVHSTPSWSSTPSPSTTPSPSPTTHHAHTTPSWSSSPSPSDSTAQSHPDSTTQPHPDSTTPTPPSSTYTPEPSGAPTAALAPATFITLLLARLLV